MPAIVNKTMSLIKQIPWFYYPNFKIPKTFLPEEIPMNTIPEIVITQYDPVFANKSIEPVKIVSMGYPDFEAHNPFHHTEERIYSTDYVETEPAYYIEPIGPTRPLEIGHWLFLPDDKHYPRKDETYYGWHPATLGIFAGISALMYLYNAYSDVETLRRDNKHYDDDDD
jgi:hypothetical protein